MASRLHIPAMLAFNLYGKLLFNLHTYIYKKAKNDGVFLEDAMEATKTQTQKQKEKSSRRWKNRISFSATLPSDVRASFADNLCVVRYSANPFTDIRESILEMILKVGVHDWDEMEDLVYCYIALNSPELHHVIAEAFVSL